MYDPSQEGSLARQSQVQQGTQGSKISAEGSQFTQNISPASTASTMDPGRSTTQSRPCITNKEERANFEFNKALAREAARELAASKLQKHSLTSPSTGASFDQKRSFTALEIKKFRKNTAGLMRAVLARNEHGDKDETTRAMWEALSAKVEHDKNPGAESSEGSEDQSADGLEERARDSNGKMSGLASDAHDPSEELEWVKKAEDEDDDHAVYIGSTFD